MPNISIAELNRLRRVEAELQSLRESRLIEPFARAMGENLGLIVANMPVDNWPHWVKGAFNNAREKYPLGGELYARRMESVKPN